MKINAMSYHRKKHDQLEKKKAALEERRNAKEHT